MQRKIKKLTHWIESMHSTGQRVIFNFEFVSPQEFKDLRDFADDLTGWPVTFEAWKKTKALIISIAHRYDMAVVNVPTSLEHLVDWVEVIGKEITWSTLAYYAQARGTRSPEEFLIYWQKKLEEFFALNHEQQFAMLSAADCPTSISYWVQYHAENKWDPFVQFLHEQTQTLPPHLAKELLHTLWYFGDHGINIDSNPYFALTIDFYTKGASVPKILSHEVLKAQLKKWWPDIHFKRVGPGIPSPFIKKLDPLTYLDWRIQNSELPDDEFEPYELDTEDLNNIHNSDNTVSAIHIQQRTFMLEVSLEDAEKLEKRDHKINFIPDALSKIYGIECMSGSVSLGYYAEDVAHMQLGMAFASIDIDLAEADAHDIRTVVLTTEIENIYDMMLIELKTSWGDIYASHVVGPLSIFDIDALTDDLIHTVEKYPDIVLEMEPIDEDEEGNEDDDDKEA